MTGVPGTNWSSQHSRIRSERTWIRILIFKFIEFGSEGREGRGKHGEGSVTFYCLSGFKIFHFITTKRNGFKICHLKKRSGLKQSHLITTKRPGFKICHIITTKISELKKHLITTKKLNFSFNDFILFYFSIFLLSFTRYPTLKQS